MKFYILDSLGESDDERYCITNTIPDELDDDNSALEEGGELEGHMPSDPFDIKMYLDEDFPKNLKIGSLLSTADDYVMVHADVVRELEAFEVGEVVFLPFTLIDHKGKSHSKDYRFVVPKRKFDVIHEEKSEIDRDANGVVIGIDQIVLDKKKVSNVPDIFRISDLGVMGFSETLANKLIQNHTNFVFDEVPVE